MTRPGGYEGRKDGATLEKTTQVYVIEQRPGYCKVGVSSNFPERLKSIEMQGGFKATRQYVSKPLLNGFIVENQTHERLEAFRAVGEWFSVPYEDAVAAVRETEKEIGVVASVANDAEADERLIDDFFAFVNSLMSLPKRERQSRLADIFWRMSAQSENERAIKHSTSPHFQ